MSVNTVKKRHEVEKHFQWDLTHMISSDALWQDLCSQTLVEAESFLSYKGTLQTSPAALLECLIKRDQLSEAVGKAYVYAQLKLSEDSTDANNQALADQSDSMIVKFSAAMSFLESEIIAIGEEKLQLFMAQEEKLQKYSHMFHDINRLKDHILSPEIEEVLAKTQEMSQGFENIYQMINNADMKFGSVTVDGNEVELTQSKFVSLLESENRALREEVFNQFYDAYIKQKNTIAATYSASVKKDVFYARERRYGSSLEASLQGHNIDISVYHNLIQTVNKHLPLMHQYMEVRKKALNVEKLHMYDIYTPMVLSADIEMNYQEAKKTVLQSLNPLGEEYVQTVAKSFNDGWIDVYENEGKRSGAFSWGAYGCHPYVLLNYNNKIDSMFTLTHEMGHAMHSHYTWATQPYIYGDYTIFLAEVASTVNEALLMEYLLKETTDEIMRKYLVNYYMEQFRGTVFRQTMFAEFELNTHEMAERGEALTSEALNSLYRELNRKYYGNQIILDEKIDYEWSRIPHFYTPFYVYQYATGYSAAIALSKMILEDKEQGSKRYIEFLKSGSSDYSLNLLKKAGVDMSSPKPVEQALKVFGALVEQFNGYLS